MVEGVVKITVFTCAYACTLHSEQVFASTLLVWDLLLPKLLVLHCLAF